MKVIVALLFAVAIDGRIAAQRAGVTPAVPIDPVAGILDMYKTHDVVALSEGSHGNEQGHAFRLELIRDPRLSVTVNDIVVEFGNALYQPVIDRFVQGQPVAYEELRKVWQDTTQRGTVWDRPIYEAFYRAIRDVNATLPVERRLRVLLGDPVVVHIDESRDGIAVADPSARDMSSTIRIGMAADYASPKRHAPRPAAMRKCE